MSGQFSRPAETAELALTRFDPGARAKLSRKGVVLGETDTGDGGIEGLVVFDQPIVRVWELLSQANRQREYRPELKRARTIERDSEHSLEEHELRIMFIGLTYRLRFDLDSDQNHIGWALDTSFENDVDHVSGDWWLFEMEDGRTLGLFRTR
ncbi:MAG: hypothetical protein VCC04_05975, partial [Myxococcota bacterium]